MSNKYWATSITGGSSGSLDSIDPTDTDGSSTVLAVGDICEVVENDMISQYTAKSNAGIMESIPDLIIPDTNPGNWYWELIERIPQNEAMITAILYGNIEGGF
jgi:hypothetical protein